MTDILTNIKQALAFVADGGTKVTAAKMKKFAILEKYL